MSDDLEPKLTRQLAIWTGLYGPAKAESLTEELRVRMTADPDADVAGVVAALDPDDEDWEESGLSRPGFG